MASILVHFPTIEASVTPLPTKKLEPFVNTPAPVTGSGSAKPTPNVVAPPAQDSALSANHLTIPMLRTVTRVDQLHWIDPVLANALSEQFKKAALVSKDKLPADVYIAPSEPVDQNTLLQLPQDATRYYFLPIFKIREEPQHIFVQFAAAPGTPNWRLDVKLVEDKSPDLRPPPLSYTIGIEPQPTRVYLAYTTSYGTAGQHDFESCLHEIIDNKPGYSLSLNVNSMLLRDEIFFAMTRPESKCEIVVVRNLRIAIADPSSPTEYRIKDASFSYPVPFSFPYETHHGPGDIYSFAPDVLASPSALQVRRVPYAGLDHFYFKDPLDSTHFYYLPDSFKLCRCPWSPHYPCMSISFEGDTFEKAQVTVSYVAMPVVDQTRIEKAQGAEELTSWAGGAIHMDPLPAQDVFLSLRLPGDDETGPYPVRADAHVNVITGVSDAITKPLADFRRLFEALFEKTSPLFRGYVTVKLGDTSKYEIDISARIDDLVGPVFEQTTTLQDATTILVTMRNAIEGPIQLLAPPTATVQAKDALPISGQVHAPPPPPPFPLDLNAADDEARRPADQLQLIVASSALLVDGQYQVFVSTQHLVNSTGQEVLDAILDPEVESRFTKKVTVKIAAGAFASQATPTPRPKLVAVEVSFERGDSASFEAPTANSTDVLLSQTVMITQSIVDYLLMKPDDGSYKYRVAWIYENGHRVEDGDWRTSKDLVLFPDVVPPASHGQGGQV